MEKSKKSNRQSLHHLSKVFRYFRPKIVMEYELSNPPSSSITTIIVFLLFFIFLVLMFRCASQKSAIIREAVPSELEEYIRYLQSSDAYQRAYGAYQLGIKGNLASPAIPYLINILSDNRSTYLQEEEVIRKKYDSKNDSLNEKKLNQDRLIEEMSFVIVSRATTVHSQSYKALKLITNQDFGPDPGPWIEWWNNKSQ
jgi:hypothetical protein